MKKKVLRIISLFLIIFSFIILNFNAWKEKKQEVFDMIKTEYFENKEIIDTPKVTIIEETEDQDITIDTTLDEPIGTNNTPEFQEEFIAVLEIPKIKLKRGLVDINSPRNDVSKNIMMMPISSMPDVENGNLVLAAHSGTGPIAFFKNLYKLTKDDQIYIYYQNILYLYKIINIYNEAKIGQISIERDYNDTSITLITCTYKDKTSQTIYIGKLVSKSAY